MNRAEIKKAWETMKREVKKELGENYAYGFTMSLSQTLKGTATKRIRKEQIEPLVNSAAFKKFSEAVGGCRYTEELDEIGLLRLRFFYNVEI